MPTAFPQEHAVYVVVKVEDPRLANHLLPKEFNVKVANCTFLHLVRRSMSPLHVSRLNVVSNMGTTVIELSVDDG